jgi:hypothetical protein
MIALVVVVTYLVGWLTFTVQASRFAAANDHLTGECHYRSRSVFRSICQEYHGKGCWRTEGEITPMLVTKVSGCALFWPILGFPALAYWLAKRQPTPQELERRVKAQRKEIKQLEKELGIAHD